MDAHDSWLLQDGDGPTFWRGLDLPIYVNTARPSHVPPHHHTKSNNNKGSKTLTSTPSTRFSSL